MNTTTKRATKRSLLAVIAGAMLASLLAVVAASPASAAATVTQTNISGVDRYATSALVATKTYTTGTNAAVLVNGESFADGLAASTLAGVVGGPVLLTHPTSMQGSTGNALGAIDSLKTGTMHVYIVGGTNAVSAAQEAYLKDSLKYTVTRVSGADRYATAAAVADKITTIQAFGTNSYNARRTAFLVSGTGFADGLAASGLAFNKGWPVLLTDGTSLTAETKAVLDNNSYNIGRVIIVGGTAAVSAAVATEVDAMKNGATGTTDVEVKRLSGANRYATAVEVAKYSRAATALDGEAWVVTNVVLVSGESFPDALSAAARAGTGADDILMLTAGAALSSETDAYIKTVDTAIATMDVIGGTSAVSASTSAAANAAAAYNRPTVTITGAVEGSTVVTLLFSEKMTTGTDAVRGVDGETDDDCTGHADDVAAAAGTGIQLHSNVEVNNADRTANTGTAAGCQTVAGTEAEIICDLTATSANYKKKCTVTLGTPLAVGDVFSYGGTATTISLAGSRVLAETSVTVANDVSRPTVTLSDVHIDTSGNDGMALLTLSETPAASFTAADVKCMKNSADTEVSASSVTKIKGLVYEVVCPAADTPADSTGYIRVTSGNTWTDLGANEMLADVKVFATTDTAKWSATATVGAKVNTARGTLAFNTGSGGANAGDVTITSVKNGACDGAHANAWSFKYIDNNGAPAVSIYDTVTKVVTVTGDPNASHQTAAPTAMALANAMNADANFKACWVATVTAVGAANNPVTTAAAVANGSSYKTITINFSESLRNAAAVTPGNYDVRSNGLTDDAANVMAVVAASSNSTNGTIVLTTTSATVAELPTAGVSKVNIGTNVKDMNGNGHAATQYIVLAAG